MSTVPIHTLSRKELDAASDLPVTIRRRKLYEMPDGNLMTIDAARAKYGSSKRKFNNLKLKELENND